VGTVIVLADDDPDLRTIYASALRGDGHEVCEACDGNEAVAIVIERQPALLLLDLWMPHLNGYEVLERLLFEPAIMTTQIVILSNLGDGDSRLEGFSGGVTDYWVKGLSLDELRDRVRQILAGADMAPDPS
jgi:DNA-binding response OmpR family regulator